MVNTDTLDSQLQEQHPVCLNPRPDLLVLEMAHNQGSPIQLEANRDNGPVTPHRTTTTTGVVSFHISIRFASPSDITRLGYYGQQAAGQQGAEMGQN